jgi:hypothetical protein
MTTFPDPVRIAGAHQRNILALAEKIRADLGCIGQLLIGRTVRRREDGAEFEVREARIGPTHLVSLYGHRADRPTHRRYRAVRIGLVDHIDLVEPK